MDYTFFTDVLSALTPLVILVVAVLGLTVWRADRRRQARLEEARLRLEHDRLAYESERDDRAQSEQEHLRAEEAAFRRATWIPEGDPDGVFILHISSADPVGVTRLVAAAQAMYAAHGFERPEIVDVERGSVKVKFRTRIANLFRDERTRELLSELRIAAEEASIGRVVSENNERNANAASQLIREMREIDGSAEYISPTMAVVKTIDEEGRPRIQVRIPTARELVELREADTPNQERVITQRAPRAIQASTESPLSVDDPA
ncbi:hypothetical protein ACI3KX_00495 [Microbacterium sp. ZW CA_36]|uniref:hypothetical protein n=1 Tax=Microbacterium sp. ZW CA_36 TaxID=3378078 RepID=UPI003853E9DE